MKKVLFLFMMCMAVISAYSQNKHVVIDRNCKLSGQAFAILKTEKVSPQDAQFLSDGSQWYIDNKRIGNKNYVSFWIETPNGKKKEYNSWNDHGVTVYILNGDEGTKSYTVSDDTFCYLVIIEIEKGKYLIQLHTSEL